MWCSGSCRLITRRGLAPAVWSILTHKVCSILYGRPAILSSIFLHGEWFKVVEHSISQNWYCFSVFGYESVAMYRSTPTLCLSKSRKVPMPRPTAQARGHLIHYIRYHYMTPAALLFSLYSSKLPIPPSAPAPSPFSRSLSVFISHSSSSEAMICSNRCCCPLARYIGAALR